MMVPVTEYVEPGGAGILAWLLGVIRILNEVRVVVTGMPQLVSETVLEAGLDCEQYVVEPALFVIATSDNPPDTLADKVTVAAVTVSVPVEVCRVNVSRSVAEAPGAIEEFDGSVPSPRAVVAAGGFRAIAIIPLVVEEVYVSEVVP